MENSTKYRHWNTIYKTKTISKVYPLKYYIQVSTPEKLEEGVLTIKKLLLITKKEYNTNDAVSKGHILLKEFKDRVLVEQVMYISTKSFTSILNILFLNNIFGAIPIPKKK